MYRECIPRPVRVDVPSISVDNRTEVREFLLSRRAKITPQQAGLPDAGQRRVPGLRRGEVATLAGVSVEYYAKLERGSLGGVSPSVLDALARALQLDDAERAHLFHLAHAADGTSAGMRPRRNGLSYIAVISGLFMMRVTKPARLASHGPALAHLIEGYRFARHTAPIRSLLLLLGLVSLVAMPYTVLMPVFADQILHGGARGLGILMGATGVGAMLGALTLATRSGVLGLGRWVAFSCGGFGLFLVMFSFSHHFWLSAALLLPVGFCMMLGMSSSNTLIQAMTPDHLRGRVMAMYTMMFMGMAPFGSLFAGASAEHLGATFTVAVGAVACVGAAVFFFFHLPKIRVEARQLILAQDVSGGEPSVEMTARVVEDN